MTRRKRGTTADRLRAASGAEDNGRAAGDHAPLEGAVPVEGYHRTDLGNARRLADQHGRDVRHCHPWGEDLVWDGRRWKRDDTAAVERLARDVCGRMYVNAWALTGKDRQAQIKHALKSENAQRLRAMISLARSEEGIPVLPEQLDADPMLLNVLNGTIDLTTGRLRGHRREDLLTKLCPVEYNLDALCPLWEAAVHRWMGGNAALVRYLQRVAGYCLTGDVGEQCLWFLHGRGANGKTTLMRTLLAMLGDYAWQAVPELLLQKRADAHPTERADLFSRRLVATIEVEEGKRLAEALVKLLTGGDRITARRCYQNFFEFAPTHKLFLVANHKPTVRGTDHAVWRRIKLVPFDVTIPDDEKDPQLSDKLAGEWPGVLAWCVAGCLAWQRDGLGEPKEITSATATYRAEQDLLAGFIAGACCVSAEVKVQASVLYDRYKDWSGDHETSQKAFTRAMEERGYPSERGYANRQFYKGIGLPG
jgi:putative DNA primase/helicase